MQKFLPDQNGGDACIAASLQSQKDRIDLTIESEGVMTLKFMIPAKLGNRETLKLIINGAEQLYKLPAPSNPLPAT